jgi:hypothetical protein
MYLASLRLIDSPDYLYEDQLFDANIKLFWATVL